MKFKAQLVNPELLETALQSLEKIQSRCQIVISPEGWAVRAVEDMAAGGGVLAFAELKRDSLFENYRVVSKHKNMIALVLSVGNLMKACKSSILTKGKSNLMLVKKGDKSFLSCDITRENGSGKITQDIPVDIEPSRRIEELSPPQISEPPLRFKFPELKSFKSSVDKMKLLSNVLSVSCEISGDLTFFVDSSGNLAQVSVTFHEMYLESREEGEETSQCWVDIRRLTKALSCHKLNPIGTIGGIATDQSLVMHVDLGENVGSITYYIPVLVDI